MKRFIFNATLAMPVFAVARSIPMVCTNGPVRNFTSEKGVLDGEVDLGTCSISPLMLRRKRLAGWPAEMDLQDQHGVMDLLLILLAAIGGIRPASRAGVVMIQEATLRAVRTAHRCVQLRPKNLEVDLRRPHRDGITITPSEREVFQSVLASDAASQDMH